MDVPTQVKRANLPFLCLFVLFRLSVDWVMLTCFGEGDLYSFFNSNTNLFWKYLTSTHKNNVLPSLTSVKLTHKCTHQIYQRLPNTSPKARPLFRTPDPDISLPTRLLNIFHYKLKCQMALTISLHTFPTSYIWHDPMAPPEDSGVVLKSCPSVNPHQQSHLISLQVLTISFPNNLQVISVSSSQAPSFLSPRKQLAPSSPPCL